MQFSFPGGLRAGGRKRWLVRTFVCHLRHRRPDLGRAGVRLAVGDSPKEHLQAYCQANAIERRLEDKMPAEVLKKFKNSVLVYYGGKCAEKLAHLDLLPAPSQVHFADYLKGGFDNEYPDHLPPRADFGTPQEFRAFVDKAHALGHLVMPYTNPTWWCDGPKGPTFERHGEAPLLKTLDGELRTSSTRSITVSRFAIGIRPSRRQPKTVEQFLEEYPVDILFQDQCARGGGVTIRTGQPHAVRLHGRSAVDGRRRQPEGALSTESGWDRVVNAESQLCGMTWSIVPPNCPPGGG